MNLLSCVSYEPNVSQKQISRSEGNDQLYNRLLPWLTYFFLDISGKVEFHRSCMFRTPDLNEMDIRMALCLLAMFLEPDTSEMNWLYLRENGDSPERSAAMQLHQLTLASHWQLQMLYLAYNDHVCPLSFGMEAVRVIISIALLAQEFRAALRKPKFRNVLRWDMRNEEELSLLPIPCISLTNTSRVYSERQVRQCRTFYEMFKARHARSVHN